MQEAYKVAEVHERVGSLEQEVHTLKHQVLHLEKIPPRVSELERAFEGMQYIRADQVEIKAGLRTINDSQQRLSGDIDGSRPPAESQLARPVRYCYNQIRDM